MKSALLFSLLIGAVQSKVLISSDRFLFKILDKTISLQDLHFHARNFRALNCIYPDSLLVQYFGGSFSKKFDDFLKDFPVADEPARQYLHQNRDKLKKILLYFKILKYSEDQKAYVSTDLAQLVRETTRENKCDTEVLHREGLKTNFTSVLRMELYFRSRYGGQFKEVKRNFDTIKGSIDLFAESLDKQFTHEYYW